MAGSKEGRDGLPEKTEMTVAWERDFFRGDSLVRKNPPVKGVDREGNPDKLAESSPLTSTENRER